MFYEVMVTFCKSEDDMRVRFYNRRVEFENDIVSAAAWAAKQEAECLKMFPQSRVFIDITSVRDA